MAEWLKTALIDIVELIGGGTPKTSKAEYWGGNINWLSVKDFNNENRYVYSTEKTITEEGLNNSSTKLLKKDDIIISARGTVGELAMIPFPMAFNQSCYGIRAKEGIDSIFLYYLIKNSVRKLKAITHGSVFDTITRDTFANIEVAIPDIKTQHRIAKMLADIDDKVENNQRINNNLEEQARLLLRAEQNKQSIMTSIFGNVIKKGESFDYNNNNLENTKLYESFMKSIIYQQKYINDSEFDIIIGKISGFGKKFNDKLGMKIFPEDMESRYLTVNKTLDQMNRAFQLQALGLNALSSISNMFGGTANAMINAGKYFTKDDYLKTQAKFLWEKLQGDENAGKILAAVDYFAPFVDSYNRDAKKKLSLMKLTPEGIQDFLMVGLRKGDEMIQYMNAFTFIKNMIVIDGQVKNVREYLRSTDEYKDFYAGNAEQRKERKEKFEEDVNKLIEEKGLLNVSKLSEDGILEIPGIERKSDSIIEQRRIIQQFTSDALGSLTEDNRRLINLNVYGSSLMVFKNWIPRLVDVRVGALKYNAAYQAYEWGRYRTFYSMLIPDILKTIKSLTGAVTGNSDVWLEQVRQMFEKQKEEYFNSTGKELKMTESEFISLVNQNIKNQALDLMILTTLLAIGTVAKAMAPDDDEDENVKNVYRFMLKATDKVTDEVAYFYNPMTPFNLISTKGVFPSVGILNNYAKFLRDFALENYGMIINDDEIIDDAKPIKYLMKSFPVSSQLASYLPMFYPELAKDLGIKMQSTYGVR
jgi:hypothetical protein